MRILASPGATPRQRRGPFPYVLLRADSWDDFGFKTLFQAELWMSSQNYVELGGVKIMRLGLETSKTTLSLPRGDFTLDAKYCSLGQATSYYETLFANLPKVDRDAYLHRIRDVTVLSDQELAEFRSEPAFNTSLLRTGGAQRALTDAAQALQQDSVKDKSFDFQFVTSVGGGSFTASFVFGDSDDIPSRLNAIIGYNGVGRRGSLPIWLT